MARPDTPQPLTLVEAIIPVAGLIHRDRRANEIVAGNR
jgi:hypothetical protein